MNKLNTVWIENECLLLEGLLLSYSLLFPTTVSLVTCFISVNTGEENTAAFVNIVIDMFELCFAY